MVQKMDFESMKYQELQAFAKGLGLKANVKAEKLIKSLKQHYKQEGENEEQEQDENVSDEREQEEKDSVFVTTRREKANRRTKRKISDPVDNAVPSDVQEGSAAAENSDHGKKRKLTVSDEPEPPQQPLSNERKDVPVQHGTEKSQRATAGKIPRLQKTKPITPNFRKLHEEQFRKMESIDSYFQRRTKQMEISSKSSAKDSKKANQARTSLFSCAPDNNRAAEDPRRRMLLSASKAPPKKPATKEDVPFRPSVLSTRRINVRFSEATFDNEHKKSLIKTPARMSPCLASSTPQRPAAEAGKPKTVQTATTTPKPFLFTGNTSMSTTPGTQKKQSFDLKASLSRPLTYKPHTGKLKPFGEVKENTAVNKSLTSNPRQEGYKQHKVQTRNDRRTKAVEGRKQKKDGLLGARRGLVMM